ncbi:hypothetical protein, partial [Salmonella sp. SAL4431]|uniref:hypothetical protein n=1 Tax=Salmonella sp. SAL4431 TaxID=3159886 RepID=UPI00397A80A2
RSVDERVGDRAAVDRPPEGGEEVGDPDAARRLEARRHQDAERRDHQDGEDGGVEQPDEDREVDRLAAPSGPTDRAGDLRPRTARGTCP